MANGFAIKRTVPEGWTFISAEPKSSFIEYGEEVFAGDGGRIELGYCQIIWDYGDRPLTGTEMYQIQRFCNDASHSEVFVQTKTRLTDNAGNPVWRAFRATMFRPQSEFLYRHNQQLFINVVVEFRGSEYNDAWL